ncbi:ATP-binding protein [Eubacteriaceae bacterium ES2]|nr:ATP-binding protein [Eubacteriaceae bacterium ES2]
MPDPKEENPREQSNYEILETRKHILEWNYDHENVVYSVIEMARKTGFNQQQSVMISTAASELSTNILRYANSGKIQISIIRDSHIQRMGIKIVATDRGPGISDLKKVMEENYSTFPGSLGLGLPSVKHIMDQFWIESELGAGTRVEILKWLEK